MLTEYNIGIQSAFSKEQLNIRWYNCIHSGFVLVLSYSSSSGSKKQAHFETGALLLVNGLLLAWLSSTFENCWSSSLPINKNRFDKKEKNWNDPKKSKKKLHVQLN